ncbi:MAG: OsmC family protein [marine benthic group bacterium]|jgi:organic hydroperoxide reductase OsmC/OhrA|nr:OsmC family protein [Candidatus Benthicola marisminoris]
MLGTLNGALEVRAISLPPEDISADVEGINELENGVPVLTRILVRYRLRVPGSARERVERALERHAAKCPTAASLKGAVEVEWEADIEETD